MSANRTVTCFRSPSSLCREARIFSARYLGTYVSGGGTPAKAAAVVDAGSFSDRPQLRQNLALGRLGSPQLGQGDSSRVPHASQNIALAGFSDWQWGHFIPGYNPDPHIVRVACKRKGTFWAQLACHFGTSAKLLRRTATIDTISPCHAFRCHIRSRVKYFRSKSQ